MLQPFDNKQYSAGEFELHGESQMMRKLAPLGIKTIFDVGCNHGEWTMMARSHCPDADIHMFELVPDTFHTMIHEQKLDNKMFPNSFGLSDEVRAIEYQQVMDNDKVSTVVMDIAHEFREKRKAIVSKGDIYCQSKKIEYIDVLKMDTEGHEYEVLLGFEDMLKRGKIGCIQFEYGLLCILTKNLLIDFCKLLVPYGYVVGRQLPHLVNFKDYHLLDETFQGPNYVAVHGSRADMIDVLKG